MSQRQVVIYVFIVAGLLAGQGFSKPSYLEYPHTRQKPVRTYGGYTLNANQQQERTLPLERYVTDFIVPGELKWIKPSKRTQQFQVAIPGTTFSVNMTIDPGDIGFSMWVPTTYGYVAFGRSRRGTMAYGEALAFEFPNENEIPEINYYYVTGYNPEALTRVHNL